ncbi:hypothetical protein CEXT_62241 [Caerostris extrusa]|uniref:Uncharacterized protein n=1 Tax=Caerostris extrusa TaxID=172846 RepID=A0AAV4RBM3_CAEEX|nr:hypothetical protein CEXT_62241 [Caerostris extrusa]
MCKRERERTPPLIANFTATRSPLETCVAMETHAHTSSSCMTTCPTKGGRMMRKEKEKYLWSWCYFERVRRREIVRLQCWYLVIRVTQLS